MNSSIKILTPWFVFSIAIAVIASVGQRQKRELNEMQDELRELKSLLKKSTSGQARPSKSYHRKKRFLAVKDVVGDGVADDFKPIQRAINKASKGRTGATVVLPKGIFLVKRRLKLKAGVTLVGQGYGNSPLNIDATKGGSTIAHCGTDYAMNIVGHGATVENLAVTDYDYGDSECVDKKSQGGVFVYANATTVESVIMRNVLIIKFTNGPALTLKAENAGGIAYASFENVRIRYAKTGIHLTADSTSFVNSNNFLRGAISGEMTDQAVLAEGPGACNDNKFTGVVIEPPKTDITHVLVKGPKTNVRMHDVRLEGSQMPQDKPLVIIEDDSYGNVMNGMLGHTFVQADFNRNPGIQFTSGKMMSLLPPPNNLIWNAAFSNFDSNLNSMPGWSTDGTDFALTIHNGEGQALLYANHNILQVAYNGNGNSAVKLQPLDIPPSPIHSFVSFGIYAQSSVQSSISAVMKYESGNTIASSSHSGSGKWEFIGMSALYDKTGTGTHRAYFSITGDVNVTAPTFVYGSTQVSPGAEFISSSGGRLAGVLSFQSVEVEPQSGDRWIFPQEGNIFVIKPFADTGGSGCTTTYNEIYRVNDQQADRFAKGSVITIMFPDCGGCVPCLGIKHNDYISLLGGADLRPDPSLGSGASLTLVSVGTTWKEVSRNAAP